MLRCIIYTYWALRIYKRQTSARRMYKIWSVGRPKGPPMANGALVRRHELVVFEMGHVDLPYELWLVV